MCKCFWCWLFCFVFCCCCLVVVCALVGLFWEEIHTRHMHTHNEKHSLSKAWVWRTKCICNKILTNRLFLLVFFFQSLHQWWAFIEMVLHLLFVHTTYTSLDQNSYKIGIMLNGYECAYFNDKTLPYCHAIHKRSSTKNLKRERTEKQIALPHKRINLFVNVILNSVHWVSHTGIGIQLSLKIIKIPLLTRSRTDIRIYSQIFILLASNAIFSSLHCGNRREKKRERGKWNMKIKN